MILCFQLSMPNVGSWNGKWTGDNRFYAKIINMGRTKKGAERARRMLDKGYYHYNFGDGWSAGIDVREVDSATAAKLRRKSKGFCGYDWMINSIIDNDKIIA